MNGEAKGAWGTIIGKVGHLPGSAHHVVMNFDRDTQEKLTIGDKVQIKTHGVDLKLLDHPEVYARSCSPALIEAWGFDEDEGKLAVPVTKIVPADFVGLGHGGSPPEANNWEIQTHSPDAVEHVKELRFGDMALLKDILSAWGRGYYEDGATVGVVSCGPSPSMGQGIGVTTLLTCKGSEIVPQMDPGANLKSMLKL